MEYNNTALVKGYREHFFKSLTDLDRITVNTIIRESIDFMKIITEYIENVYMVGTDSVESSLVPMIIHMENKHPANVNIIVSKTPMIYSIPTITSWWYLNLRMNLFY